MRVLLSSNHRYPAYRGEGVGLKPMKRPSGSGGHIHDLLARGLAEMGHEVFYLLREGADEPMPSGVTLVREPRVDVDIFHRLTMRDEDVAALMDRHGVPHLATCHLDLRARGLNAVPPAENWIFVSRTMAQSFGSERFVWNGLDPVDFLYREEKEDYLLFLAWMDHAEAKGLDIALDVARPSGHQLLVCGSAQTPEVIQQIRNQCEAAGARYLGDVRGRAKARLLAGARAVLVPTRVPEAFGLVIAEALFSGTPVICGDRGACPELVIPQVGFVCTSRQDYLHAVKAADQISSAACRARAWQNFHYHHMVRGYLGEYAREIARHQESSLRTDGKVLT